MSEPVYSIEFVGDPSTPVRAVAVRVTFDVPAVGVAMPAAAFVTGCFVYPSLTFDGGTSNTIEFAAAGANLPIGSPSLAFAICNDTNVIAPAGGAQVDGKPTSGTDTTFTPMYSGGVYQVFVSYGYTGAAPTQGEAICVITYMIVPPVEA